jgi:hypothetical protein
MMSAPTNLEMPVTMMVLMKLVIMVTTVTSRGT